MQLRKYGSDEVNIALVLCGNMCLDSSDCATLDAFAGNTSYPGQARHDPLCALQTRLLPVQCLRLPSFTPK